MIENNTELEACTRREASECSDLLSPFEKPKGRAWHKVLPVIVCGQEARPGEMREVNVMVVSGKYAMVRRPSCMPYVAMVSDLFER